ncbi:hypothetical protein CDEST_05936 [Colletotrichum destructivum]|uniref:Zn(2)-C6 fungal-type domain-containing protein n=1 Tax=Colletotrichum destructivum TaxID=34406 RepID=A0AAX4IBZ6_9PEZI|nr:hypothetical protein CDEST_05936 [Colletotrichum destructivum]
MFTACDQCRIKKIRCDKERPRCSNCNRLGIYCNWSGHGKKPNQTVLLNQSIAAIEGRLERIEGRLSFISQTQQHLAPHYAAKPPGSMPDTDSAYVPGISPPESPGSLLAGKPPPPAVHHIEHGAYGYERYFGPTSLISLLHHFDDLPMLQCKDSNNKSNSCQANMPGTATPNPVTGTTSTSSPLADAAGSVRRLVSLHRAQQDARDVKQDGRAVVKEPSMLMLVALVDPYFQLCNPHLPIWTRAGFRKQLNADQENANAARPTSFAVCANNLVLLTLIAMALHGQAKSSMSSNSTIDREVIQSYIENASRAISRVGQLLEPRLINVQALVSLVCLTEEASSLTLDLAHQVAKSMGLYQSQEGRSKLSPEEFEERQNILYCLYCLDKTVCWSHGCSSSNGSAFGFLGGVTGTQPPADQSGDTGVTHYMSARFALAQIDDVLYASLYGPDVTATQCFEGQSKDLNFHGFEAQLRHWADVHGLGSDAGAGAGGGESAADDENDRFSLTSRLDLEISYKLTHMQLLLRFLDDPEVSVSLLEDARSCLVSLQRLWAATSDPGHCSSFARLASSFPPTVVCRLACEAAKSEGPGGRDLELLGFLGQSLRTIASLFATGTSYMAKLSAFVDIMLQFVQDSHQDRTQGQQLVFSQQQLKECQGDQPSPKGGIPRDQTLGLKNGSSATPMSSAPTVLDTTGIDIVANKEAGTELGILMSCGSDEAHESDLGGGYLASSMELWSHESNPSPMAFGGLDGWVIDTERMWWNDNVE